MAVLRWLRTIVKHIFAFLCSLMGGRSSELSDIHGASIGQVGPPTVSPAIRRTSVEVPMGDESLLHRHPDGSEQSSFTIATMSPTDTPFSENGQRGGMGLSALDSGLLEHMARNRIVGEVKPRMIKLFDDEQCGEGELEMKLIFSCPLDELSGKCLDITQYAAPKRFRFFSVQSILDSDPLLEIYECEKLPPQKMHFLQPHNEHLQCSYCAISYVWKGVKDDEPTKREYSLYYDSNFSVKGAEDADPISIQVLRDIAWAARNFQKQGVHYTNKCCSNGVRLIWLDRISIIQTSDEDKAWQIGWMSRVYSNSTSLVLPGGLQRLVGVNESTSWVDRAWTLQEALAPDRYDVYVLWRRAHNHAVELKNCRFPKDKCSICLIQDGDQRILCHLNALLSVQSQETVFGWSHVHTAELQERLKSNLAGHQSIWRSSIMRTSSRPVDMVFSIMHFQYADLDPLQFTKDDRIGALIALCQQEDHVQKMEWFFALFFLPPSLDYSIFPLLPQTSVDGQATWLMHDGSTKIVKDFCATPLGELPFLNIMVSVNCRAFRLDDEGYIHMNVALYPLSQYLPSGDSGTDAKDSSLSWSEDSCLNLPLTLRDVEGVYWSIVASEVAYSVDTYAIKFGCCKRGHVTNDVFAIVKSDGDNNYRRVSSAISSFPTEVEGPEGPKRNVLDAYCNKFEIRPTSIRLGGPRAYKRKRCRRHASAKYFWDLCDDCGWSILAKNTGITPEEQQEEGYRVVEQQIDKPVRRISI